MKTEEAWGRRSKMEEDGGIMMKNDEECRRTMKTDEAWWITMKSDEDRGIMRNSDGE